MPFDFDLCLGPSKIKPASVLRPGLPCYLGQVTHLSEPLFTGVLKGSMCIRSSKINVLVFNCFF